MQFSLSCNVQEKDIIQEKRQMEWYLFNGYEPKVIAK